MTLIDDPSCVDDEAIRRDRRARLFAAMDAHGLDVLVLGRPAEVAFATGARQLWTAGSRPFGPACIAVRSTGRTHLLSVSDHDVPGEVGHDDLFGLSWNPANIAAHLAAIPGLRDARRVGTTSSSPGFPRLLTAVAPHAEVVDGAAAMWAARAPKSPAEVERIRAAVGIAEQALAAMAAAVHAGVTERELRAVHLETIASLGAPTPPTEAVASVSPTGRLVALDPGAFHRGYEGGVGRTRPIGGTTAADRELARRCRAALDAVVGACRPGATGADLLAAWEASGEPAPRAPLAVGLGLGVEPPVIGAGLGASAVLAEGTVLAVTARVGDVLEREVVHVRAGGADVLTTAGRGLAGEG